MPKPVDRRHRRHTRGTGRAAAAVRGSGEARSDAGSTDARLIRLFETPHLARAVPHLAPEIVHELIRYRGLDASAEILVSMTPAQLSSVLDLDLWRRRLPGSDEEFDVERFAEWLQALVDTGEAAAARSVAGIDPRLMIAGLSRHVRVFDPASLAQACWTDDEPSDDERRRPTDWSIDIGGYAIRAKRTDAWDAIVALLVALDAGHRDRFDAIMRGCRRLSDSGREVDGLDSLLTEPEQLFHDVALEREERRSRRGYLSPAQARAFLEMARHRQPDGTVSLSSANPIAAACLRPRGRAEASAGAPARLDEAHAEPSGSSQQESIAAVTELLAEAGFAPAMPRALLEAPAAERSHRTLLETCMERIRDADDGAYLARTGELAFLANALVAGCSVQSRPFGIGEASDAATATCNLGLEQWPAGWPGSDSPQSTTVESGAMPEAFLADHDLVTAFHVGWAALHEMSMFVAGQLLSVLSVLRCADVDVHLSLVALRRELAARREAGTPWRARDALDAIASIDMPAWAALLGLLDECPVLPAAATAILQHHRGPISPTAFEFISETRQLREARRFATILLDVLVS